ncbi:MAG: bifunctional folylpolyglutamate synthase/dihydrofolate synthase, partial [Pseudomonadota bacterium]
GMLNTKDPVGYLSAFQGLASKIVTLAIPEELNAIGPEELAGHVEKAGITAEIADSLEDAFARASMDGEPARVLVCGSLYLAGQVLAANESHIW